MLLRILGLPWLDFDNLALPIHHPHVELMGEEFVLPPSFLFIVDGNDSPLAIARGAVKISDLGKSDVIIRYHAVNKILSNKHSPCLHRTGSMPVASSLPLPKPSPANLPGEQVLCFRLVNTLR